MSSKKTRSHHHRHDRLDDADQEHRKPKRKNDWLREERKRARELEETFLRRVRDCNDVMGQDLDDLD